MIFEYSLHGHHQQVSKGKSSIVGMLGTILNGERWKSAQRKSGGSQQSCDISEAARAWLPSTKRKKPHFQTPDTADLQCCLHIHVSARQLVQVFGGFFHLAAVTSIEEQPAEIFGDRAEAVAEKRCFTAR